MYNARKVFVLNEQRKNPRIATSNKVGYKVFSGNGARLDHGKGETVNLSQCGALLETDKPLNGKFISLMSIDVEGKNIYAKGRIVYSLKARTSDRFLTGIKLVGPKEEQVKAVTSFVRAYQHHKHQEERKRALNVAKPFLF